LDLCDRSQKKTRQRPLHRLAVPWTDAQEIGERKFVGVRQSQQARERRERLVLEGTDQQRLDYIQRMALLGGRKTDEQGQEKVA